MFDLFPMYNCAHEEELYEHTRTAQLTFVCVKPQQSTNQVLLMLGLVWFDSFYFRVSPITAI